MKKFVLVRWLEEDSVGVMPTKAVHKEDAASLVVGAMIRLKWNSTFYDAELFGKLAVMYT